MILYVRLLKSVLDLKDAITDADESMFVEEQTQSSAIVPSEKPSKPRLRRQLPPVMPNNSDVSETKQATVEVFNVAKEELASQFWST
eukprot:5145610-Karenia_brevis.AAC.1